MPLSALRRLLCSSLTSRCWVACADDPFGAFSASCVNESLWDVRSCRSKGYLGLVHLGAANSTTSTASGGSSSAATSGSGAGAAGGAEASFLVCYDHFGHGQEVYCVRGSL